MTHEHSRSNISQPQQWAILLAITVCLAGLLAWYSISEYRRIERDEMRRLEGTAQLIESAVGRQIAAINRALSSIRELHYTWRAEKNGAETAVQYLQAMQGAMPGIRSFLTTDENGIILAINRPEFIGKNFQMRDYFQVVLKSPDPDTLYLTPPFKSATNVWTMALSRSLAPAGDPFAGVVVATLEQPEFKHVLSAARYAPDLRLALYQGGENQFVSAPDTPPLTTSRNELLQLERHLTLHDATLSTPLTLRLSRERAALFAPWQERIRLSAVALLAFATLLCVMLRLWQRRQQAQQVAIAAYEQKRRTDEAALQRSEAYSRLIVSAVNVGSVEIDLSSGEARCDETWYALLGHAAEGFSLTLENWFWLVHPEDATKARDFITQLRDSHSPGHIELRLRDGKDAWHWFAIHGHPITAHASDQAHSANGVVTQLLLAHIDIAQRKAEEESLRSNEERIRSLLASIQELVMFIDTGCFIREYHQPAHQPPYFDNADALLGKDYGSALPAAIAGPLGESIVNILMSQDAADFEYALEQHDGTRWYRCVVSEVQGERKGFPLGFLVVVRDVTEVKIAEAKIRNLALYDALTNLPNRRLLDDRIQQALAVSARDGFYGALMFLDLDRFKQLNDTHGHDAGDALLREVSARLQAQLRNADTVARMGGDEFVVMLETLTTDADQSRAQAAAVAEKIRLALCAPYALSSAAGDVTWECSSSIGVVLFCGNTVPADELLKQADQAMYVAKKGGRNQIAFAELS